MSIKRFAEPCEGEGLVSTRLNFTPPRCRQQRSGRIVAFPDEPFAKDFVAVHISLQEHHAVVKGPVKLQGAPVSSTDLRAGASLVLAGIMAEGTTTVTEVGHIDRGYEDFVDKLCRLGAEIERKNPKK